MLSMTVSRLPGVGWVAYVYRDSDPDWIVSSGGLSRQEAIARARGNFDREERIVIVSHAPRRSK